MCVLACLHDMNSSLLAGYLKLAEQDGRQHLVQEARRIQASLRRGTASRPMMLFAKACFSTVRSTGERHIPEKRRCRRCGNRAKRHMPGNATDRGLHAWFSRVVARRIAEPFRRIQSLKSHIDSGSQDFEMLVRDHHFNRFTLKST